MLPKNRAREIADLAEAVAEEHCPTGSVDPLRIADACGLTYSFGQYKAAYDGMLEHKGGRFHIYCNLDRVGAADQPRSRFTVSHELGHFYIDEHRLALAAGLSPAHQSHCEYESTNLVEQEADHFASNLLMPAARFTRRAKHGSAGLDGILALAECFRTSVTSTCIRYTSLNIAPCAIVKWATSGKFQWKWLSSDTFHARLRKTIELVSEITPLSPTWRALNGDPVPERGFFRAGTTVSAWFPCMTDGDSRSVILVEEAMPIGRYGVITFLYPDSGSYNGVEA